MDGDPHVTAHRLPVSVREAVRRGWSGLAIAGLEPPGPVVCVCAVDADRVATLAAEGVAIGLPAGPLRAAPGRPRRVAIGLAADRRVGVTIDLAFGDARRVAERLGHDRRLCLIWLAAGSGIALRADMVPIDAPTAHRLVWEAALHGEWRVDDPRPAGFSRLAWWREAAGPGAARLVRGDLPGAGVVLVAPLGAGPAAGEPDPRTITIPFPGGPPVPEAERAVVLDLASSAQCALARAVMAEDEVVTVLLVDPHAGGEWVALVRVALTADLRRRIGRAIAREGVGAEG